MGEKWQSVCSKCGKGGMSTNSSGRPTRNPPVIGGHCPNSSDGKHKPTWKKA